MAETLLDAINAGIENAGPTPPAVEVSDDETGNLDGDADASNGSGAEDGESATGGGEESADGVEGEQEADGEKPGKEALADDAAKAAAAAGKPVEPKAGEPVLKPKDPVNDPIPNALKKETKERMTSLIDLVREKETAVKTAVAERDELLGMITETKSTPEQYGQALSYLAMVNSGDPVKLEQALTFMQQETATLAKMLGKPVPGVDMLADHPDLQQEVRDNLLLQERAEEIAAGRTRARLATQQSQNNQQFQQSEAAKAQALQQGRDALNAIGAQYKASDPQFEQKVKILVPALKPIFAQTAPSQWAGLWKAAYDKLVLPRAVTPAIVPGQQPLRGKNPSGGAAKAPGNLFDAVNEGIAAASGR